MSAVLDEIALDGFSGFEGGNDTIYVANEITVVKANEWVQSREMIEINGSPIEFETRYRFIDPILSSIALRRTNATTQQGRIDFNATVVAERDLEIQLDGKWISAEDFVCQVLRRANPHLKTSNEAILHDLKQYGLDLGGRLPMYLQHLGADEDAFNSCAEIFAAYGANDNSAQVASRTKGKNSTLSRSLRVDDGVAIATLEISRVDREMSMTHTGFIGFLDGFWGTFSHIVEMDKTRSALAKVLAEDPTNKEAAEAEARIRGIFGNSRTLRAFRNWGGTSRVVAPLDGSVQYYAQQVPCGRLSIQPDLTLKPITFSVWGTSAANKAASDAVPVMDPTVEPPVEITVPESGEEEPY